VGSFQILIELSLRLWIDRVIRSNFPFIFQIRSHFCDLDYLAPVIALTHKQRLAIPRQQGLNELFWRDDFYHTTSLASFRAILLLGIISLPNLHFLGCTFGTFRPANLAFQNLPHAAFFVRVVRFSS